MMRNPDSITSKQLIFIIIEPVRRQKPCEEFINKMQEEIKVDCVDILKYALAKNRRALEKEIDNPEFIKNANIQVQVKVHLENIGESQ